jgi:hypothetical protein
MHVVDSIFILIPAMCQKFCKIKFIKKFLYQTLDTLLKQKIATFIDKR